MRVPVVLLAGVDPAPMAVTLVGLQFDLPGAVARDTRLARHLRVSAVVTTVHAAHPIRDLLGDDLLADRGHHCSHEDRRGVGEVLAAMVEHADVVVFDDTPDLVAHGLATALARPEAAVVDGCHGVDARTLVAQLRRHVRTGEWTSPTRRRPLPDIHAEGVWRLDLQSSRPFHPERLLASLELLGSGNHRSRGCFWLPTRPGRALEWDGAGGQLSIGDHADWGRRTPFTRLVVTGVGVPPPTMREDFDRLLLTPGEAAGGGWRVAEDGYEPRLGPIRDVA